MSLPPSDEELLSGRVTGLQTFDSPEDFKQYLAEQVEARHTAYVGPDYFLEAPASSDVAGEEAGAALPSAEAGSGGGFSTTNIQEAGVDEADVVKNDATHLYILAGNELRIVRAVPAEDMAVESTVDLPDTPQSLYLRGDTVVVISRDYRDGTQLSTLTLLDITDRTTPLVEASLDLEGSLADSRLIGSKLHLILSFNPTLPDGDQADSILEAEFDELIPDLSGTIWVRGLSFTRQRNLVEWGEFYRPDDPDGYGVVAVVTLDVDAPLTAIQSAGVMADAEAVYASTSALYLTNSSYDYAAGESREETEIHKFDFTDDGAVAVGSGTIPGRILNRFSLSEYEGYLRAATTVGNVARGGGDATNNVYVLAPGSGGLSIVGKVEDIAPGERIYAARFVGERGFLVTFKKVNPLFTLDLSNPALPKIVGELKVPGYSDYIHPLGQNHLLTIGKDAIDMGDMAWYQGVQLSIFDVTDFADPQRVDVEIVGDRGTESEALYDPHAFNYFAPLNMLAVPMTIAEGAGPEPSDRGEPTFQGLRLFQVVADEGIEPVGQIATASTDGWYYSSAWIRGIFMDDQVYAVTSTQVQAVPLADLNAEPLRLPLE